MLASGMRVFLLLLWTARTPQGAGVQVLPPVNFTLTVCALAQVLLHWEPNPAQEQNNSTIRYDVKILSPVPEEYDTKRTRSVRTAALHDGFMARVRTLLLQDHLQMGSDWVEGNLPPLPGAADTSATNVSCVTRVTPPGNVSLHCSWLPGQGAPEDTQYFLFYRYEAHTEECATYTKDKRSRNTECTFASTQIKADEIDNLIVIHINGSSQRAAVKPFQRLFNQNAIEKVNIPRNISISLEQNDLLATWEKPISPFHEECFEYEFYLINLKSDLQPTIPKELGKTGQNWIYSVDASEFRTVFTILKMLHRESGGKMEKMWHFPGIFPWNSGVLGEVTPIKMELQSKASCSQLIKTITRETWFKFDF